MCNKRFCKNPEKIENYDKAAADNFKGWDCHHRLETHNSDGERRLVDISKKELIALGMYWNRPSDELIFLKHSEHYILHNKGKPSPYKGKRHSEETKNKMSEAWDYDKHFNEETKNKMSESHKGKNIWTKGTRWFNDGKINKRCYECPPGFVPGRLLIY